MITTCNPYRITWIQFKPVEGEVSRHDAQTISQMGKSKEFFDKDALYEHFANREKALAYIEQIKAKRLDAHYECRLFTDKQYGMRKKEDGYKVPFTAKQYAEVYTI